MGLNKYTVLVIVAVMCVAAIFLVSSATGEGPFSNEETVRGAAPSPQVAQPGAPGAQAPMPSYVGGCGV